MVYIEDNPGVHWVGVIDWSMRGYHGHTTEFGSTYNSYLIDDQQPVVIDTVREEFYEEYVRRLAQQVQLDTIRYLVVLHAELDHAGCVARLYPYMPACKIVCSATCERILKRLHPSLIHAHFLIVDARTELRIGQRTLRFIPTPMLHWPEQMMCYCPTDEVLFSSDAFGQHYASSERWADLVDRQQLQYLQKEYLANLFGPYQQQIAHMLNQIADIRIQYILPAHGLGYRPNDAISLRDFINIYQAYANETHIQRKIVIMFDTMYGQSARVANSFSEGVQKAGYTTVIVDLKVNTLTKIATECFDCCAICVISATFALHPMPNIYRAIKYLEGLQLLRDKQACCIVGYGWASCHNKLLEILEQCKTDLQREKLQFTNKCTEEFLNEVYNYANQFAEKCMM